MVAQSIIYLGTTHQLVKFYVNTLEWATFYTEYIALNSYTMWLFTIAKLCSF